MTNNHGLPGEPLLAVHNLQVVYGGAIEALRDVSFEVHEGQIVALLGANGAGKSTVLKAVSGILDFEDGEIEKGEIKYAGAQIGGMKAERIVARGLVHVPEGRRLFASMTVQENLIVGGHHRNRAGLGDSLDYVYHLFPRLLERRTQISGYLSGGEQQMVAIGRALMSKPRILALDEPSLGLAPLVVNEIFERIRLLSREEKLTILLVEQNAKKALAIADHAYIMENGRVMLAGSSADLQNNPDVREFYLGIKSGEVQSMRDVKHYKRRKRWLS
ncbi:MAG: ABC transporter ATP-binding protein [Polaromonas sp.]|uniref:ABC transporter ATP-binding protein n=1 Tax=Polaromonas sp. TaxID=1869339 RepID=UPI0027346202|nr:ABC transporter ATP-binding protein [Polaromonas sp.]MDP3799224.1 ABC transporter ATP-binding protein [Polaromonas sp.]